MRKIKIFYFQKALDTISREAEKNATRLRHVTLCLENQNGKQTALLLEANFLGCNFFKKDRYSSLNSCEMLIILILWTEYRATKFSLPLTNSLFLKRTE
jgi:hypothetical protein